MSFRLKEGTKPLSELNLADSKTVDTLAKVTKTPCSHGAFFHECYLCAQAKITAFLTYETFFAIGAHQFLSQPLPKIEVDDFDRHECKTLEEVRRYCSASEMADEEVQKCLASGPIIFQSAQSIKIRKVMDEETLEKSLAVAEVCQPQLLAVVTQTCKSEGQYLTLEFLRKLDHSVFFEKIIKYFQHNVTQFELIARECGLSIRVVTDFVLPRLLGIQGKMYLETQGKSLLESYPPLEELFFSGIGVFDHVGDVPLTQFFDPFFPTYDVHRVMYPTDSLCEVAGPHSPTSIPAMFENTLFNRNYPIDQFVVLGEDQNTFLINYFLHPVGTKLTFRTNEPAPLQPALLEYSSSVSGFEITVLAVDGDVDLIKRPLSEKKLDEPRSTTTKVCVKSLLTQEERMLTVHFFQMPVGGLLDLSHPKDLDRFAKVYELSAQTKIGVQSSKSAVDRSSVVIFAFELARYLYKHSAKITSDNICKAFEWVLHSIRRHNPSFINSDIHYLEGIRLGGLLYSQFAPKVVQTSNSMPNTKLSASVALSRKLPVGLFLEGARRTQSLPLKDPDTPRPKSLEAKTTSQILSLSNSFTRGVQIPSRDYELEVAEEFAGKIPGSYQRRVRRKTN